MPGEITRFVRSAPHEWIKKPWEEGGYSCRKCGRVLSMDELVGVNRQNSFTPRGYICQECGNRYPKDIKDNSVGYAKMNWRAIA